MDIANLLHAKYCPLGDECWCGNKVEIVNIDALNNVLRPGEKVLFHGTSHNNLESIMSEHCSDPSFGVGVHMSPCIRFSSGFGDVILVCAVTLGDIPIVSRSKMDRTSTITAMLEDQLEYVICNSEQIRIVSVIKLN